MPATVQRLFGSGHRQPSRPHPPGEARLTGSGYAQDARVAAVLARTVAVGPAPGRDITAVSTPASAGSPTGGVILTASAAGEVPDLSPIAVS